MKKILKVFEQKISCYHHTLLSQFIKFGIVGISNTLISYGVEMLCYYIIFCGFNEQLNIMLSSIIAFIVSVSNSYYWNTRYVFVSKEPLSIKQHIHAYCKMAFCYSLTGLVVAPALKIYMVNKGIQYWMSGFIVLIITIPLNFMLNKFWAFKNKTLCTNKQENGTNNSRG